MFSFFFMTPIFFLIISALNIILDILNDTKQNKSKQIVAKNFDKKLEINIVTKN